jgi:hypothetical protein
MAFVLCGAATKPHRHAPRRCTALAKAFSAISNEPEPGEPKTEPAEGETEGI